MDSHRAWIILGVVLVVYIAVLGVASYLKYERFGQGFDQVDFEQAIWNAIQGRGFEDVRFNFTESIFGVDFMPFLAVLVPFYALVPSANTLFVLQTIALALGAIPVFLLARDKLKSPLLGLVFAFVYLLYPTVQYINLSPIQLRAFALVLLLYAFYFFEQRRWVLFAAFGVLAAACRTDVSLVLMMFGFYELAGRRNWRYVLLPVAFSGAYFFISLFVIVPSFTHPAPVLPASQLPFMEPGQSQDWLGSNNSLLIYYKNLGSTPGGIVKTIVTHPLQTLGMMFTPDKIWYMVTLLLPVAFLPLLGPRALLLALPILLMNLLSDRVAQFDYRTQYSALAIPGMIVGAIYGFSRLKQLVAGIAGKGRSVPGGLGVPLVGVLLIIAVGANVALHNPVLRTLRYHESDARVAAAQSLIAMIPSDASVAASSFVAPRLLPRRYLYNFPPQSYTPSLANVQYILVDTNAVMLEGRSSLTQLQESPSWKLVASKEGFMLFHNLKAQ
ncbi:MAG: DUF2079 domain-containing protein [Chloroflexi bacterium]|nr:DUF2079 domain-containing protein [Chloroflexota bacterium]